METKNNDKLLKEAQRWRVLSGIVSEQAQQPQAQQPQTQQPQAQQVDQKTAAAAEASTKQALDAIMKQLPSILQNFSTTVGDKDGQIETGAEQKPQAQPQQQVQPQPQAQPQAQPQQVKEVRQIKFNESKYKESLSNENGELDEALIAGLVASAPAIMNLGGKAIGWVGKKIKSQATQNVGTAIANAGHKLHHTYISTIEKIILPFTKSLTPENRKKAAEAVYLSIIAGLFATSITAPDAMSAVKGQELFAGVKSLLPKILSKVGIS